MRFKSLALNNIKLEETYIRYFHERKHTLLRSGLRQLLLVNPFFSILFVVIFNDTHEFLKNFAIDYLIASIISIFITTCLYTVKALLKIVSKMRSQEPRSMPKIWWFALSLCAMPPGLYLASLLMPSWGPALGLGPVSINPASFRASLLVGALIGGLIAFWGVFLDTRKTLRESEMNLKQLENQHLQSQLSALTAQMNPHLLFNSLNTVASLIMTEPGKAEDTIVTLSELYRGVLNSSKNMMHSLSTELDLCEAYLKIEKARFCERVHSEIFIAEGLHPASLQIPSLCLQPLVENAVKHGISKRAVGGRIQIRAVKTDLGVQLSVEDDGHGFSDERAVGTRGTGTGIANCRDRVKLHYGSAGNFEIVQPQDGGTKVILTLPMEAFAEC